MPMFRSATPLPIRLTFAVGSVMLGLAVWTIAWLQATATHSPEVSTTVIGLAALCAGFVALGVAHTAERPLLPTQLNTAVVLCLAVVLFAGFPRPPFIAVFALMVAIAVASLQLVGPRPSLAFGLLAAQGMLGAYIGWAALHLATAYIVPGASRLPLALWAALSVGALSGMWHGRSLVHRSRSSGDLMLRSR